MPKRPKTGPPYTDIPDEVYVVVIKPWGVNPNPRDRVQHDFDRIAAWAQFALQQTGLCGGRIPSVECIYAMGTRDEVILQFSEGTNIIPLLGEHRWADFSESCQDPYGSTRVFLYNWTINGDPANHNWTENYPKKIPLEQVPAKSPYPVPSWTSPPSTLVNLVRVIPRSAIPLPIPNPGQNPRQEQQSVTSLHPSTEITTPAPPQQKDHRRSGEQLAEQEPASNSLFRPYEPPPHHPSHAQFLDRSQTRDAEASSFEATSPKFVKKLDPYELEENALSVIRSSPKQEEKHEDEIKPNIQLLDTTEMPRVKKEEDDVGNNIALRSASGYQPSQALVDAFNSLHRSAQPNPSAHPPARESQARHEASQALPPASLEYQPSAELEAEINALLRGRTNTTTPSLLSRASARPVPGADTRVTIKREYEDDMPASLGEDKKIKIEED